MEPFTTVTAQAAVLRQDNVDTDQILPGRFLKKPREAGYDNFLFHDVRRDPAGSLAEGFPLNGEGARAKILVAGDNFGCGSSREGAVYALVDAGIRAVLALGFADIFRGNCRKNGVLAATLAADDHRALLDAVAADPTLTIELAGQTITAGTRTLPFEVDDFTKETLLAGRDDIAMTLTHKDAIDAAFAEAIAEEPWLDPSVQRSV